MPAWNTTTRRADSLRDGEVVNDWHSSDQIRLERVEVSGKTTRLTGRVVRTGRSTERRIASDVKVTVHTLVD